MMKEKLRRAGKRRSSEESPFGESNSPLQSQEQKPTRYQSSCQINQNNENAQIRKESLRQSKSLDWQDEEDQDHNRINLEDGGSGEEIAEDGSVIRKRIGTGLAKKVGPKAAKAFRGVNQIVAPIAIVVDTYNFSTSAMKDCKQGTTRNTTTVAAGIAGGWGGAIAGAELGAALGAVGGPVGMVVGGIVGGVTGTLSGSWGCETAADKIGDATGYDMELRKCSGCGKVFKARKYQNMKEIKCPHCSAQDSPLEQKETNHKT